MKLIISNEKPKAYPIIHRRFFYSKALALKVYMAYQESYAVNRVELYRTDAKPRQYVVLVYAPFGDEGIKVRGLLIQPIPHWS